LAAEAENERTHLMVFREIALPNIAERVLIWIAQLLFFNAYFLLYLFSRRVAHRMSGYFEEEAIRSYSEFLARLDSSELANPPAPPRAQAYWQLPPGARLNDVVRAVLQDEVGHRDVNHALSDQLRH
jgi:ubiquinol oxidase